MSTRPRYHSHPASAFGPKRRELSSTQAMSWLLGSRVELTPREPMRAAGIQKRPRPPRTPLLATFPSAPQLSQATLVGSWPCSPGSPGASLASHPHPQEPGTRVGWGVWVINLFFFFLILFQSSDQTILKIKCQ